MGWGVFLRRCIVFGLTELFGVGMKCLYVSIWRNIREGRRFGLLITIGDNPRNTQTETQTSHVKVVPSSRTIPCYTWPNHTTEPRYHQDTSNDNHSDTHETYTTGAHDRQYTLFWVRCFQRIKTARTGSYRGQTCVERLP